MLLAQFILVTYILVMQMIKDDIGQVEHLYVLLMFAIILFTLATHEDKVKGIVYSIEHKVGWNQSNKSIEVEPILQKTCDWMIADYKSSNCRRWVRRCKVYVQRIFFFFNVKS